MRPLQVLYTLTSLATGLANTQHGLSRANTCIHKYNINTGLLVILLAAVKPGRNQNAIKP